MTVDIALTFGILGAAIVVFVGEWIRADLVALLVLVALVLAGLVGPEESLSGFANPAVVTTWSMFILSAGLSRTGVSSWLGRQVLRLAGAAEARLIGVLMSIAGSISAFMFSVGVTAVFLPITMDVARRTRRPPSRLLLPVAYGALLGSMLTLVGTASNLVVADFVRGAGLTPLALFDFTPVGLAILATAIGWMLLFGRRLLPVRRTPEARSADGRIRSTPAELYGLEERLAVIVLSEESPLTGRTLAESRIGPALGLSVLRVQRREGRRLVPEPGLILEPGDRLLVLGRLDALDELTTRPLLAIEDGVPALSVLLRDDIGLVELEVAPGSPFDGRTLIEMDARRALGLSVLAVRRGPTVRRTNFQDFALRPGDRLLGRASPRHLDLLRDQPGFRRPSEPDIATYQIEERLLAARIPPGSPLAGRSLREARLAAAFGISVLGIRRGDVQVRIPEPEATLEEGDLLILEGRPFDLTVLRGLQTLAVERDARFDLRELEDGPLGVVEVLLSPQTTLAGRTLRQLRLRERFGVSVLAIWRGDRPYRTGLSELPLGFGDGLLCYGTRQAFELLARERDFVVLELAVQEQPRRGKAPLAALIMAAVVAAALLGLLPIAVAAIAGAALMVLTRCLTMEEAYRAVEWKAVFLIAAMLPLGFAMQRTGAAALLGDAVVRATGPLGPTAVLAGLMALTLALNQFIPSAANAVVMTPLALATAAGLGASPYPFVMGVAYAVAASFMTPVSHPTLVLVMSPGNYRFGDYLKNGLPLVLIVLVVSVALLPLAFPF
jgi:di/tricarboxylate transporter